MATSDVQPSPSSTPSPSVDEGANRPGDASWIRRLVRAFTPRGRLQIALGIVALVFLGGAVGYTIGRSDPGVSTSAVDDGFLVDMSDHHDQAITMAQCGIGPTANALTRTFAREVLIFQARDLGRMQNWLADRDVKRPAEEDRAAMEWMGMSSTAATMPGMATSDELDAMCRATGPELDRQFLTLMRDHHEGGVHMASYAAEHAADPEIRAFAEAMARNQAKEVGEYQRALAQLGLA